MIWEVNLMVERPQPLKVTDYFVVWRIKGINYCDCLFFFLGFGRGSAW